MKHPDVQNILEQIKETLTKPVTIRDYSWDEDVKYYYFYYKEKARYLRVIVKYLNGEGFIITAHFIKQIR